MASSGIQGTPEFLFGEINSRLGNIETMQKRMESKLDQTCSDFNSRITTLEVWRSNIRAQTGLLGIFGGVIAYGISWFISLLSTNAR